MHTKDVLAEALLKCGLKTMAAKATEGYYHDYLSPIAVPTLVLVEELQQASLGNPAKDLILKLRQDVMEGKHDATKAEAEAWAHSAEARAVFAELLPATRKMGDS